MTTNAKMRYSNTEQSGSGATDCRGDGLQNHKCNVRRCHILEGVPYTAAPSLPTLLAAGP